MTFRTLVLLTFLLLGFGLSSCDDSVKDLLGGDDSELDSEADSLDLDTLPADGDLDLPVDGDKESELDGDTGSETEGMDESDTTDSTEEEGTDSSEEAPTEEADEGETPSEIPEEETAPEEESLESDQTDTEEAAEAAGWVYFPITLSDPIQVGDTIRVPIDAIAFAEDHSEKEILTDFGWDVVEDNEPYVWHIDEETGIHSRKFLTGSAFALGENFCNGEDWCQFIGFDPGQENYVILGPQTGSIMRVNRDWSASLISASGTRPSNSAIDYNHVFAWPHNTVYVYGYAVPSGAGSQFFSVDLTTGVWTRISSSMKPVQGNCLVYDEERELLFSFAGLTDMEGGGGELEYSASYLRVGLDGQSEEFPLPGDMGSRENMACAYDPQRDVIWLFGGCKVVDYFNEIENTYHNDLWTFDPETSEFTQVIPDVEAWTFEEDSYGDMQFIGDPDGPNFGQNRGRMAVGSDDRLFLLGAIPIFTHERLFTLDLSGR